MSTHYSCISAVRTGAVAVASVRSRSFACFNRVKASNIPFHASLSILSSCKPLLFLESTPSEDGRPTPREGGTEPGGGAFIAEGAIRDWRIWAKEDLMVS